MFDEGEGQTQSCDYAAECLALSGSAIGMHHCPYCGTMVVAGVDPSGRCETDWSGSESRRGHNYMIDGKGEC